MTELVLKNNASRMKIDDQWMVAEDIKDIFFYFCHTWMRSFANNLENSCAKNYKYVMGVFHDTNMTFYYGKNDSIKFEEYLVNKIVENHAFGNKINSQIYKFSDKLAKFAEKLSKLDLKKLSSKDMISLIEEEFTTHTELYEWGWLSNATDMFHASFTNHLKKFLSKFSVNESKINQYLTILSEPEEHSILALQHIEFLEIIAEIQNNHPNTSKVKSIQLEKLKASELKKLESYWKKYHHLKFLWIGKKGTYSLQDYMDQVNEFINSNLNANNEIKRMNSDLGKKVANKLTLISELRINSDQKELFDIYSTFMLTKAYRREAQIKWSYEFNKLLAEVANRLGITINQAYFMLPNEMVSSLKIGSCDKKALKERTKFCVYYTEKDFEKIYTGEEAKDMIKNISEITDSKLTELKGQCACTGHAIGRARLISTISDMHKMEKGNILVAITTNPDLLPAMKIASAFVTEQGGITSHAAIVARELNKPCVIGTKLATRVFKDGDMIEVLADKGIVRKLDY